MRAIPIAAAKRIADAYGYDQVVIIARRAGESPNPHGEHCTTYGVDKAHCRIAALIGNYIKHKIMHWPETQHAPGCASSSPNDCDCGSPRNQHVV